MLDIWWVYCPACGKEDYYLVNRTGASIISLHCHDHGRIEYDGIGRVVSVECPKGNWNRLSDCRRAR